MKIFIITFSLLVFAGYLSAQTVFLNDDFEDGNMDGWTKTPDTCWVATSVGAINGSYSIKHMPGDTIGGSHLRIPISGLDVTMETVSWRFNLKNGDFDPTSAEKFWVYLMLHDTTNVNGYAVGINLSGDTDTLSFWKVSASTPDGILIKTTFDWNNNSQLGIEVTRDASGVWELRYDTNGNFDQLVSAGTAHNEDYTQANYFGLSFYHAERSIGKLWLDDVLIQSSSKVTANVLAFLEGPFDADSMKTSLSRDNFIPLYQPFGPSPWNYSGDERILARSDSVVDWILVQLRTGTDSLSTVATRAALLKNDGSIVDTDGSSPVSFTGIADGNYYVVVRHRNHLPIMTATAIALSGTSDLYDFSSAITQAYGSAAQVELSTGIYGVLTGDANGNGQIQTDDNNDIWAEEVGTAGYRESDYNLNGQVQTDDKNDFWNNNVGNGTQVPF